MVVVVWNYIVTTTTIETITTLIVGLFLSLLFLALTAYYAFWKLSWTTLVVLQPHKTIVIKDVQALRYPSNWWRLVDKGDKFLLQPRSFFLRYRWINVVVANKKDVKPSYAAFVSDLSSQGIQIL